MSFQGEKWLLGSTTECTYIREKKLLGKNVLLGILLQQGFLQYSRWKTQKKLRWFRTPKIWQILKCFAGSGTFHENHKPLISEDSDRL